MAPDKNVTEEIDSPPARYQWPGKGRKAEAAELRNRGKVLEINTHDTSRLVKMAPRAIRRARQGDDFRPVYHHGIPTQIPHKDMISAMGVHKKGRVQAKRWLGKVNTARACVSFGLSIKLFLANVEKVATELRHATLKANGLWIEKK